MAGITSKDLLMLLLYVPGATGKRGEPIYGRTLLQKIVFLFSQEVFPKFKKDAMMAEEDIPLFDPDRFGPFSKRVLDDIEFLVNLGFVERQTVSSEAATAEEASEYEAWSVDSRAAGYAEGAGFEEYRKESLALSELGCRFVEERLLKKVSDNQLRALEMLKRNCTRVSLQEVLHYVYSKYPNYTSRSEIRDKILSRRRRV